MNSQATTWPEETGFDLEGADASPQKAQLDALAIPVEQHITIHMVHLNHLDLSWYWRLPDTVQMCLETIRWHTRLLEAHPEARYSHTQCFILHVVEQLDPDLFRRFAALVRRGQVELDSGQVVEPDHNLPSGEALARQFLYGQRYLESRFGQRATTLVNSDSFGHCRSLPQVLRQAGIRGMIFKRPRQCYVALPESPFLWQGIDGTQMPALRFINKGAGLPSLSQYYQLPAGVSDLQEKVRRNLQAGVHHLFASHCNADSGGVTPYLAPFAGPGYEVRYSTPRELFAALAAESPVLPALARPLGPIYQGCYTTHIAEKEHCRRAERELREVELLWTLVALDGAGYPGEAIAAAWWRLCFLQFHDIITGTGSPEAHQDSASLYHELFLDTLALRRQAQIQLDRHAPGGSPRTYLVANPRPASAQAIAEVDVELPIQRGLAGTEIPAVGALQDDEGNSTPYQIVDRRQYQRYVRGTMLFPCSALPPLGLKAYRLVHNQTTPSEMADRPASLGGDPKPNTSCDSALAGTACSTSAVTAKGCTLENEYLCVQVGGPGIVRSIVSKADGREWLRGSPAPVRLELWPETDYRGDYGTPMKAWMLGTTERREDAVCLGEPTVLEQGPVRATQRIMHRWANSVFRTDVSLYSGQEWVELRTEIDWHEKEVLARLCVEPALAAPLRRLYGIPFGHEEASGQELEVPAVGWAALQGSESLVALLNRDRPGHTFRDGALRVSLVRCATGDFDPCTDSGVIRSTIRILPVPAGELRRVVESADEFMYPPVAWQAESLSPELATMPGPLLRLEGSGIQTSSVKLAEDGRGVVVRLYEATGARAEATLHLGRSLAGCSACEANLLEDAIAPLRLEGDKVRLAFAPFQIRTLIFALPVSVPESACIYRGGLMAGPGRPPCHRPTLEE